MKLEMQICGCVFLLRIGRSGSGSVIMSRVRLLTRQNALGLICDWKEELNLLHTFAAQTERSPRTAAGTKTK